MQEQKHIMGLWKFGPKVSREKLGEVAQEWAKDPGYLQLYIRKVSKDQMGIGFTYRIPEAKDMKEAHEEYYYHTSDQLKRNFGNDLAGWDLSSPVWTIK